MAEKSNATVYIGNLDDRVSERVLYDILIQAGRVVNLHIPRDRESDKPKGYAFAEYESEEVANYAVKLFSGLVTLYKRTLKFNISGQDKPSLNLPDTLDMSLPEPNDYRLHHDSTNYSYSRRAFGAALDSVDRSRLGCYDTRNSGRYRPY